MPLTKKGEVIMKYLDFYNNFKKAKPVGDARMGGDQFYTLCTKTNYSRAA